MAAEPFPLVAHDRRTPFMAEGILAQAAEDDAPPDEPTTTDEPAEEPPADAPAQTPPEPAGDTPAESAEAIIAEAAQYGFSAEDAEQLGDALPIVLAAMDRQAVALLKTKLGGAEETQPADAQPRKPEIEAREPAKLPQLPEKLDLKLNPDNYDEDTLGTFTALTEHINKQQDVLAQQHEMLSAVAQLVVATHGDLSKITTQTQSQSNAAFSRDMDSFFASLGDEFKDVYGKEPMSQLAPNSPKVTNRNKLVEEMETLSMVGRPFAGTQELATRTLRALHAEKLTAAARHDVERELKAHRRKAIARPSGRIGKPASRDERAKAVIREKLIAMGIGVEE